MIKLTPSTHTAAAAGVVAALVWPWLWSRFGGPTSEGSTELIVSTLLVVALPAHAFVVGFQRVPLAGGAGVDTQLLKRIGAWLGAAAVTVLLRQWVGI
jgi:membrane-associated phospholipid phosphatase